MDGNQRLEWCKPISEESPSGPNLEYDSRFQELCRAAEGTREQQYGSTLIAAKPPDWLVVEPLASELATETRDLRLGVLLVEAATHHTGIAGLAESMELLQSWVCQLWESIHPQLDPEDELDPFIRINSLARLCEPERLPAQLMAMPLVEVPPHTKVTLHDYECLREKRTTKTTDGSTAYLSRQEIDAAFRAVDLGRLRTTYAACQRAEQALSTIVGFVQEKAGESAWDASLLMQYILKCSDLIREQLRNRFSVADSVVTEVASGQPLDASASQWAARLIDHSVLSLSQLRVESREDAAQVLETVIRFFESQEPSSPVPLLLKRARRLINQDFVEILRDLAPDGLRQAQSLTGVGDG